MLLGRFVATMTLLAGLALPAGAMGEAVPTVRLAVPFTVSHGDMLRAHDNCHTGFQFSGELGGDVISAFLGRSCTGDYRLAAHLGGWVPSGRLDSCLANRTVRLVKEGSDTYASVRTDKLARAFFYPDYAPSPYAIALEAGDYELTTDRLSFEARLQKLAEVKREGKKAPRHRVRVICPAFEVDLGRWTFRCWSETTDSYYTSDTICPKLVMTRFRHWPFKG